MSEKKKEEAIGLMFESVTRYEAVYNMLKHGDRQYQLLNDANLGLVVRNLIQSSFSSESAHDKVFEGLHAHLLKTQPSFQDYDATTTKRIGVLPKKNMVILFSFSLVFRHRVTTELLIASLAENVSKAVSHCKLSDPRPAFLVLLQSVLVDLSLRCGNQIKWAETIVELMFLFQGMNGVSTNADSDLSNQIDSVLSKIGGIVAEQEEQMKQ